MSTTEAPVVASNSLLDFQMINEEQLKSAAILVIRTEPRKCLSFDERELQMLIRKMPKGGMVLFMKPGQSLETITEDDMRGLGWVKSNTAISRDGGKETK